MFFFVQIVTESIRIKPNSFSLEKVEPVELSLIIGGVLGAVLNRFSGYTNISWLPGRNVYYSALILFALSWLWVGPLWAAIIFVSFVAYRFPGWYTSLDMGTYGDTVIRDTLVMWARGLFFFPVFAYAYFGGSNLAFINLIAATSGATFAYLFGNHVVSRFVKDPFWFIEAAAGASFGFFLAKTIMEYPA